MSVPINYERADGVVKACIEEIESEGWDYYKRSYLINGKIIRSRFNNLIIRHGKYLGQNGMAQEHTYIKDKVYEYISSLI